MAEEIKVRAAAGGKFSVAQASASLLFAWPVDTMLGLFTTAPTGIAPGNEYGAQGYARLSMRRNGSMPPDPPPTLWNQDPVFFGPFGPVGVGAEIGWICAFATPGEGGAFLMWWELNEHKTPLPGDSLVIDPGELVFSLN
jgi:hypothetical protein